MEPFPREAVRFAKRYFKGDVNAIAEVGVDLGLHAQSMYDELQPKILYLIDAYRLEYLHPNTNELLSCHKPMNCEVSKARLVYIKNKHFVYKMSHEACHVVPSQLDMVYIDASHDEVNVKRDIACWFPKIRMGGILCGHDFHSKRVAKAVLEIFPNIRLGAGNEVLNMDRYFNAEGNDWWLVKISGDLRDTAKWMVSDPKNFLGA